MSCYNPTFVYADMDAGLNDKGELQYKFAGIRYSPEVKKKYPHVKKVPCGHCLGCRLDYSRSWADRMFLELDHTGKGLFCTLTYDQEHVPISYDDETGEALGLTLNKRDMQLFMKRLRRAFPDREIRFYGCGEYGKRTQRPHMHIILFGLSLEDFPDRKKNLVMVYFKSIGYLRNLRIFGKMDLFCYAK